MMKADKNYNRRTEKDYNWFRTFYYMWFLGTVVYPVTKLMYNIKIEGRENVPKKSNVIYAGNYSMMTINCCAFLYIRWEDLQSIEKNRKSQHLKQ